MIPKGYSPIEFLELMDGAYTRVSSVQPVTSVTAFVLGCLVSYYDWTEQESDMLFKKIAQYQVEQVERANVKD